MSKAKFAGVCIVENGKILLVQEAHKEAHGLWSLPLGHVEERESESITAMRETKEETGYDVTLGKSKRIEIEGKDFKSTSDFYDKLIQLTIFEAEIDGGFLKAGDDVLDAKWFLLEDYRKLPLRGEWMKFFV
jgi:8-oxo-dGTP diphosphatase